MAHRRTLIVRMIPFLVAVTSAALPAQAQYSGGHGTADDPYQIATAADLIALGNSTQDYDKHFVLTADIDLDPNSPGGRVFDKAVIAPDAKEGNWSFDGTPFIGVFDGGDHTISHLTVQGGDLVGLFGCVVGGAQVRNLGLVDVRISGTGVGVGALAGLNVGRVTRCYSTGTVRGKDNVGGLAGVNFGTMTQCHSTCAVEGRDNIGGLLGWNHGDATQCYSTGAVTGTGNCAGGLAGSNCWGSASRCYSTATVSGESYVGGLAGNNETAEIVQCYSTGVVYGTNYAGGLVGWNHQAVVDNCFWDTQTSGQASSAGGTGKTTAEMQTAKTFLDAGWDFVGEAANGMEDIWWIDEGKDYPCLWWEAAADER